MTDHENRKRILIVDDARENVSIIRAILEEVYDIFIATNGERAIQIVQSEKLDLVLLDIMMPGINGYEVCSMIKSDPAFTNLPVIFLTGSCGSEEEERGFSVGAVDYILKPINPTTLHARVKTHLSLADQAMHLESLVKARTSELSEARIEIVDRLGIAAGLKDNETGEHVLRVGLMSEIIGLAYGMPQESCDILRHAAPMHDIGKIGVPECILHKPASLNDMELKIMRRHTDIGATVLGASHIQPLAMARDIALTHHEKWDGTGYPQGLVEDKIPLSGRIVAIADVFDALTSSRPYKEAWPISTTIDFMFAEKGAHFDPKLIQCFENVLPQLINVLKHHANPSKDVS